MLLLRGILIAGFILASVPAAMAQVPPPPMPPGQEDVAEKLVRIFAAKDGAGYAALLADDVQVFEDWKAVAQNKDYWLKLFRPKLLARGVSFKLTPGYASTGRILFIEYFNSLASWGGTPPPDCCWRYDAVAYDVADGKIKAIRRLIGGTSRLDLNGRVVGN